MGVNIPALSSYLRSTIDSFTVIPSSYTPSAESVTYTITIQAAGRIVPGSYLKITIPDQISIGNYSLLTSNCGGGIGNFIGFTAAASLNCTINQ